MTEHAPAAPEVDAAAPRAGSWLELARRAGFVLVRAVALLLAVLLLLESAVLLGFLPRFYVPPMGAIASAFVELVTTASFWGHVGATLYASGIGLVAAIIVGVSAGFLLGTSTRTFYAVRPLIEFLRPIPSVAFIPVAIMLLGQRTTMKAALVFFACLWPILFNALYGAREASGVAKDTGQVFGLTPGAVMRRITLPYALPFIYTGIRVSAAIALLVAIGAEYLAGGVQGFGIWLLRVAATGTQLDQVFAGVLFSGFLGWSINGALVAGERRWLGWQASYRD
jgi:NitT/TauT family transport system permease protein